MLYQTYADSLRKKYGTKVYKLPLSIAGTCPNRDGTLGTGGCTFCGARGAGFENLSAELTVTEQLRKNMDYIGKRYGAEKFIAYFQSYTNSYLPQEQFRSCMEEAAGFGPQIVEVCISTRPDCIGDPYLKILQSVRERYGTDVSVELGLQSSNAHTLKRINRGHGVAGFIDAVQRIHRMGFEVCAHVILNLPWDNDTDAEETADLLSVLGVEQVKLHSLYIEKETEMARQYEAGQFEIISEEQYEERVIRFLERISPGMAVQRLVSRAPAENTLFCNWGMSWWRIRDQILQKMEERGSFQGKHCRFPGK